MTKQEIREHIRRKRGELHADWFAARGMSIEGNLMAADVFHSAAVVACYVAIAGEVSTGNIIFRCRAEGKTVCVPAWKRDSRQYGLAVVGESEDMIKGRMGIPEPSHPDWISTDEVGLMIVPGMAFDRHGGRVGYGGGYYDRLLKGMEGVSAGLAFGFQVMDHVPMEEHDARLDMVVTETGVITVV